MGSATVSWRRHGLFCEIYYIVRMDLRGVSLPVLTVNIKPYEHHFCVWIDSIK